MPTIGGERLLDKFKGDRVAVAVAHIEGKLDSLDSYFIAEVVNSIDLKAAESRIRLRQENIDYRLTVLERGLSAPGTSFQRSLKEGGGMEWVLGLGQLHEPKKFYRGDTVEECLRKAEADR